MSTVGTIGITCPRITNPINGQVDQPAGLPEYGSQATFTCNSGHRYSNIFYKVQPKSTLKNAHFLFYFAIRFVPVYLHVPPTPISCFSVSTTCSYAFSCVSCKSLFRLHLCIPFWHFFLFPFCITLFYCAPLLVPHVPNLTPLVSLSNLVR